MQQLLYGVCCFLIAVYLGLELSLIAVYNTYFLIAACATAVLLLLFKGERLLLVLFCIFCIFLGVWNGSRCAPSAAEQLQPYFGKQVVASGRIEPDSVKLAQGYAGFIMRCEGVQVEGRNIGYRGRLRINLTSESIPASGYVEVRGGLQELRGFRTPGAFDVARWSRINSLGGRVTRATLLKAVPDVRFAEYFTLLNQALRRMLAEKLPGQEGAVLSGMLLGGSVGLAEETREVFTENGLAHLLSVSGTHLVLLAGVLSFAMGKLPFIGNFWRKLIVFAILCLYACLCGLRPPVLRALSMCAVLLWARTEGVADEGKAERGVLLGLVAMALLLFEPLWLLDIGFQLSFSAAAGLLYLLPTCKRSCCLLLPDWLGEGVAVTMAAQLAVLPVEIASFHQFSLLALLSNLLLLPVLMVAALLGSLGIILEVLSSFGDFFLQMAGFLVQQVLWQGEVLAGIPYSTLIIGVLPSWCAVLYYALLLLWMDIPCLQILSGRERCLAMCVISIILCSMCCFYKYASKPLTVYFLDVGQGDCAVIVSPENRIAVIDTGGLRGFDTGSRLVVPFLRYLGADSVDLLLLSHYDADHAGGTVGVLRNIGVERLVLPAADPEKTGQEFYENLLSMAREKEVLVEKTSAGTVYDLGGASLRTLSAPTEVGGNDGSTVAGLDVDSEGWKAVLFTGDIGAGGEAILGSPDKYEVLKVAHHGSKTGSTDAFLEDVRPEVAVISCGADNRFGHPHQETLDGLEAVGSSIMRTDYVGTIRLRFSENTGKIMKKAFYKDGYWTEVR